MAQLQRAMSERTQSAASDPSSRRRSRALLLYHLCPTGYSSASAGPLIGHADQTAQSWASCLAATSSSGPKVAYPSHDPAPAQSLAQDLIRPNHISEPTPASPKSDVVDDLVVPGTGHWPGSRLNSDQTQGDTNPTIPSVLKP